MNCKNTEIDYGKRIMKPPLATKKLTTLSLLSAIALALYAVESALPPIVPIPGIKLGLANIITLVVLWKYSAKDAFSCFWCGFF